MDSKLFIEKCKEILLKYITRHLDVTDSIKIKDIEIYNVWNCKTLQNNKGLFISSLYDGMYYEITYNGNKNEFYLDAYKKFENKCIKGD